jgi:hypothetical protein
VQEAPQFTTENGMVVVETGGKPKELIESMWPHIHFHWLSTSLGDEEVFAFFPHKPLKHSKSAE